MRVRRVLIRGSVLLLGGLWAGALCVFGWHLVGRHGVDPLGTWSWAGLFFVFAGNFVFLVVVADRVCRPRKPALAAGVELAHATAIVACLGLFVVGLLGGDL